LIICNTQYYTRVPPDSHVLKLCYNDYQHEDTCHWGAGFIGSNFIRYYLQNHPEDQIINLDKLTYAGNLRNLEGLKDLYPQRYEFVKGDICNEELVNRLIKSIDCVVHFAAESHVDNSIKSPEAFIQTNIIGTYRLLRAALKNDKKKISPHIDRRSIWFS
jgi:dTDP-glucose 4,6-dehydratase